MSTQPRERVVSLFDVDDVTEFGHVRDFIVDRVPSADVAEFCRRWHYTETGGNMTWNTGMIEYWDCCRHCPEGCSVQDRHRFRCYACQPRTVDAP